MPGDKEEYRRRAKGDDHRIGESPGLPEVDEQVDDGKEVTEESVE